MISPEMLGGAIIGLQTAFLMYYIKTNASDKAKLRDELEKVKWHYQRKDDADKAAQRIYDLVSEIKEQMTEINRKLDKKADKDG